MVTVFVSIECKDDGKYLYNVSCDLLKREDANKPEWLMAVLLEGLLKTGIKMTAEKIISVENITVPDCAKKS